jgi:hypothetical protein
MAVFRLPGVAAPSWFNSSLGWPITPGTDQTHPVSPSSAGSKQQQHSFQASKLGLPTSQREARHKQQSE